MSDHDLTEWLQDRKQIAGLDVNSQEPDTILAQMFSLQALMRAVATPSPNPAKADEVLAAITLFDEPESLEAESMSEDEYRAFVQANIQLFKEADNRTGLGSDFCAKHFEN